MQYSFVVPIYRDAELAGDFCASFLKSFQNYLGIDDIEKEVELIFVCDDGAPESVALLRQVCDEFAFAKCIELNRNFGQHAALSCGYASATGEFVGMLNVDQEDPPDQIPVLLDALIPSDFDMALSLRDSRPWTFRQSSSRLFNWLLNKATGARVPVDAGTLRVMRRRSVQHLNSLEEHSRFLPGLESWFGFRTIYVPTTQQPRKAGKSSYSFRRRIRMGFQAIVSFSDLPLRFVVMLGMAVSLVGFVLGGFLVLSKWLFTDYRPGYTSTMAVIVFLGGVQIVVVGVASLYIGRILTEVQRRPPWVVRSTYKFDESQ
jgi:dolichol-phosphate mannosyltransferase